MFKSLLGCPRDRSGATAGLRARGGPDVKPVLLLELLNAKRAKNAYMGTNEGSYGSLESWISQSEGSTGLLKIACH